MHRRGLEVVFMIFLGIMVATFIGVGVYTFYPFENILEAELDQNYRDRNDLIRSRPVAELTDDEREQLREIDDRRSEIFEARNDHYAGWSRTTSIVLISFATLVMALSLIRSDQLPVISSGLLLGGVITMVYGLGWTFVSGTGISRFVVIAVALVITLVLGYIRFVRRRPEVVAPSIGSTSSGTTSASSSAPYSVTRDDGVTIEALDRRLRNLESRIDAMIDALGGKHPK